MGSEGGRRYSRRRVVTAGLVAFASLSSRSARAVTSGRTYWTSPPVFFASPNGNDGADGLTPRSAFQTLRGAYRAIKARHDPGGFNVKLQLDAGDYAGLEAAGPLPGAAELLLIVGDEANAMNVRVYAEAGEAAIYARDHAILQFWGVHFVSKGMRAKAIHNDGQGAVVDFQFCRFGSFPNGTHIACSSGGFVNSAGQNWIDGGATCHIRISGASQVAHGGRHTVAAGLRFETAEGKRSPLLVVTDGGRYYGLSTFDGPGAGRATFGRQYMIGDGVATLGETIWPGDQTGKQSW